MLQLIKHKARVRVLICVVLVSSVRKVSDYEIIQLAVLIIRIRVQPGAECVICILCEGVNCSCQGCAQCRLQYYKQFDPREFRYRAKIIK